MWGWMRSWRKKKNGSGKNLGGYLLDDEDNDSQHTAKEERGQAIPTYRVWGPEGIVK